MARAEGRSNKQIEAELREIEAFVRDGILEGRFAPGQRLVERDLMAESGGSRWAVREALRRIEVEGLVGIERNRGAFVCGISRKEVHDILDVLDNLSLFAIRLTVARMGRAAKRKLIRQSRTASRQFKALPRETLQAQDYLYENARFWQSIAEAADNCTLADLKFRLQMRLFCIQRQGLNVEATRKQWVTLHYDILTAILDRDGPRAEQLALRASNDVRAAIMALPDIAFAEGRARSRPPLCTSQDEAAWLSVQSR